METFNWAFHAFDAHNDPTVTKDLEFEQIEKKFMEIQRDADSLLADAQAFRDGVAGQSVSSETQGTRNQQS